MTPLESKLRRLAASLDTAALEALASKGLLRRAQKDLERGIAAAITSEKGSALQVQIGEFEVSLPESGPALATCSCPAAGVCQHILTAVLFLQAVAAGEQDQPTAATAESSTEKTTSVPAADHSEWMVITPDQLEHWAGKAAFKAGLKLAGQFTPEVVRERAIRIRFPMINSEVHMVPGGGLDGIIVSGGKGDGRPLVVAALIGLQRAEGKEWAIRTDSGALEASEGAPRSRSEVLEACQTLLEETLNNGLSHVSAANQQRWATLAVSALGVSLPRLALTLRSVGDEAALVVARDARSDLARMLSRMSQAHALCTALQAGGENPRADLVGVHRSRYDEVGHLDLVGAAAWPWRTASGYEGLTVLFWDASARTWNSWSESRPRHQLADFKPVGRYTQPGPWEGAESPRQLARSTFRLMNARRNPAQRLSASTKSRVLVTGKTNLRTHGLAAITDWSQLSEHKDSQSAIGLKETNPLNSIVALVPTAWGERHFDSVTQIFNWVIGDAQQRPLLLELAFDEFTEPAIAFLESVSTESLKEALVIGRIQRTSRGLSLQPYSIHRRGGEIIHLYLDNATSAVTTSVAVQAEENENGLEDDEEQAESVASFSPAIGRLFEEVDDGLLALAEGGLAALNPLRVERLNQISPRATRLGFSTLAQSLNHFILHPKPGALLRSAYVGQLHRRAMPVSIST